MNRSPPLSVPKLPPTPPRQISKRLRIPESACPAPNALPLPAAIPQPAHLPPFTPAKPALFFALVLSISALGVDCARLEQTHSLDAGFAPPAARVSFVAPASGTIAADSTFHVEFATPMDASLLLSDVAKSTTVVLVAQSNVQVIAAALVHSRLTAAESALLIPAQILLGDEALSVDLAPVAPLAPGDYALLFAARLKDASGAALTGPTEFDYTVPFTKAAPQLVDPIAGATAPENLAEARVSFADGYPGSVLSLAGPGGLLAAIPAPATPGDAVLPLCAEPPCASLAIGERYLLMLDGAAIEGASFTADSCSRTSAPALVGEVLDPRDTSARLSLLVDGPMRIIARLSAVGRADAGSAVLAGDGGAPLSSVACEGVGCALEVFAPCAVAACASDESGSCSASLSFTSLAASTSYSIALTLEDEEGNTTRLPPLTMTTLSALPAASIEEIMNSPPEPEPRDEGEYIELQNAGTGGIDLSQLALEGSDGTLRPLLGSLPPSPIILAPGGYALAVGSSFDASRYSIPANVPVLRASTQRLLGHGLSDSSLPPISLLALMPADAGTGAVTVSNFNGGAYKCAEGVSLDRVHPAPGPNDPPFVCGKPGGSIGGR